MKYERQAAKIRQRHQEECCRGDSIQIGEQLLQVQRRIKPALWLKWLKENVLFNGRDAQRYITCFNERFKVVSERTKVPKGQSANGDAGSGAALVDAHAAHRENPAWFPDLPVNWTRILSAGDIVLLVLAVAPANGDVMWEPFAVEIQSRQGDTFCGRALDRDETQSFRVNNVDALLYCPRPWCQPRKP